MPGLEHKKDVILCGQQHAQLANILAWALYSPPWQEEIYINPLHAFS